jgi:hypothetical protein
MIAGADVKKILQLPMLMRVVYIGIEKQSQIDLNRNHGGKDSVGFIFNGDFDRDLAISVTESVSNAPSPKLSGNQVHDYAE